ncbi:MULTISPECIES: cell division topological specificity factor MinE [Rheinheimera]|jgi:cell division topological specificity factor|uniref:Cell division topological specificity factor n=1 Tax=Rheinheimera pacifica TaxID=173990 RepID=A0A1H6KTE9_9GAMM|nr:MULTISPECIES: cell division topological specificity factor MinE [Rheinheimera]KUM54927.1 cell division topological specificity factor [Rheinheimera sp. EpRS3]MDR6982332.1 cell division topological specificity factor [Rheinheimera pacifica]PKM20578.1 MAG: cell division topological specificity factor MinE [Gammaproteobacteria bacterium HGW-Gammaproteobacteria-15]SEH78961.1 cell division topological specificity factor [Rheinheimera pacifica]
MSLLDYFRSSKKTTANTAKERLQIIVAHERRRRNSPDYLPQLERDILEVIRKYVDISPEDIAVSLEQRGDELSVLELNVTFPEDKR